MSIYAIPQQGVRYALNIKKEWNVCVVGMGWFSVQEVLA